METAVAIGNENKPKTFLAAARQVGDYLVKTAIWDKDGAYCNWLGRKDIIDRQLAAYSNTNGSMTPEFYSGSAGIAFFLMELYRVTGNDQYKQTALAAWLRSARYIEQVGIPASPISFYAGDLGVLYTGYRFLQIVPQLEKTMNLHMAFLRARVEDGLSVKHGIDVIGGNAGAIAPLFKLATENHLPQFARLAQACANEILERATWKDNLCFWESRKVLGVEMDNPPLTGYSHGSSGIATALMEAFARTDNPQYLLHARGAFDFENTLFNDEENNWVDTRNDHFRRQGKIMGTFRSAWCHGAPGVSLAHLRAYMIDEERSAFHLDMTRRAIKTTQKLLDEKMQDPEKDATLCHGFLGLSDILLTYGQQMNDAAIIETAESYSAQYYALFADIQDMPSGVNAGGYSPSLLTGLAGVGLHYLRLCTKSFVPSALYITR